LSTCVSTSQPAFPRAFGQGGPEPRDGAGERLTGSPDHSPWLARVRAFIEAHIADDIGLAEMADAAELSLFHFARCFKRETGLAPHRYLMGRRVELAKEMIAATDLGLGEIAFACGFAGQSHFTTAFARLAGITPGAYRRERPS